MVKRVSLSVALAMALVWTLAAGPLAQASELAPVAVELPRQEAGDPQTYTDELLGLTVSLPEGWEAVSGSQDYDLALVSPDALSGGQGAFITLLHIPGLGPDTTLESALEPLASQVEGSVAPVTAGANEGFGVRVADEANNSVQHLVLFPYGEQGEVFYIQAVTPADQEEALLDILNSLELNPPQPDYAAIDAAWQTSLAENGRLVYGEADAPIELVEFYSFTCPHCANYSFPLNRLIALDVEDNSRVQVELVPVAGDELAARATHATYCATEQGAGYSAYKTLFAASINAGREYAYSEEGIAELLGGLDAGLDMDALNACIAESRYSAAIDEGRTRFTDYGLTGTPTVLLGTAEAEVQPLILPDGQVWSGAIPVELLREIFTLITEQGVPLEDTISTLMNQGQ